MWCRVLGRAFLTSEDDFLRAARSARALKQTRQRPRGLESKGRE
jgi:hypothetical protein